MNLKALNLSQKILLVSVFIFGVIVTILLARQQQDLRNRAAGTEPTAVSVCSDEGKIDINLNYTNTSTVIVNVVVKDSLSGLEVNLGSINPGETATGVINTDLSLVTKGVVSFESSGGDIKTAEYNELDCGSTTRTCAVNEARCIWDALDNTTQYKVKVTDTDTGDLVKEGVVNHPTTSFVFPSVPGSSYTCEVTPVNSCGDGDKEVGEGSCLLPTPSDLPTPTLEPSVSPTVGPSVTLTLAPSQSPTPLPSSTPVPSSTPSITSTPDNSPQPTNVTPSNITTPTVPAVGGGNNANAATPTSIKELPPTGLTQDVMIISVIGSSIILLGAFVVIFLW